MGIHWRRKLAPVIRTKFSVPSGIGMLVTRLPVVEDAATLWADEFIDAIAEVEVHPRV